MKTKTFLIVIAVVILLSVPVPAFAKAEEKPFKGLVPMTVDGLWIAGTNLDVAVEALLPQNLSGTACGGVEYVCIAKDAVIGTGCMLTKMTADGLYTGATNLDVAVEALLPQNILKTAGGGVKLVLKGTDAILKFAFGP